MNSDSDSYNRNNLINEFSEEGKALGKKIIELIKNGTVSTDLQGIINKISEANRRSIINSHFDYKESFEEFENACPLFCALRSSYERVKNNRGRIDQNQTREAVRILLENGADPNIEAPTEYNGKVMILSVSMLGVACYYTDLPSARLLVDAGANVNYVRDNCSALTVLLDDRSGPSPNNEENGAEDYKLDLIEFLYAKGFNICRTRNMTGHGTEGVMDFFQYATEALRFDKTTRNVALPLILESCYQNLDMVNIRKNGESKIVPKAIYENYQNMERVDEKELTKYKKMYNKLTNSKNEKPVEPKETINVKIEKGEYGDKGSLYDVIGAEYTSAEAVKKNPFMIGLYQELKCPDGTINYKGTCIVQGLIKGDIVDVNGNRMKIPNTNIAHLRKNYPEGTYLAKENKGTYKLDPVNVIEIDENEIEQTNKRKFDTLQEGQEQTTSINLYENWRSIVDKNGQVTHFFNLTFPAMKQSKQNFVMIKNSNGTINEELVSKFIPVTEEEYNKILEETQNKRFKQDAGKRTRKRSKNKKINRVTKKRGLKRITKKKRNINRKSNKNK